jgi:hypothetical protein
LITSGEHYGAVIHAGFDFTKYLETIAEDKLNYTRIFTGTYIEPSGAFGIERNTIAPKPEEFVAPWLRSEIDGAPNVGKRFDFSKWNPAYFERLKRFIREAEGRGIIVEVTLFCATYRDEQWRVSPFHPDNNTAGYSFSDWKTLNTLDHPDINRVQQAFVRKVVRELQECPNIFYEIQNEPWSDRTVVIDTINPYMIAQGHNKWPNTVDIADDRSLAWQREVASWIADEESSFGGKHLIAQNWCNFKDSVAIEQVSPAVSILNFHYAFPEVLQMNRGLGKAIGYDETGFIGTDDATYRRQAWRFMMSGGSLFNHLDYSFSVGFENGTDKQPKSPGGGSVALRRQIGFLSRFLHGLPFATMQPTPDFVQSSPACSTFVLADRKTSWAIYVEARKKTTVMLNLPAGQYDIQEMSTLDGSVSERKIAHAGGQLLYPVATDGAELAIRILQRN